MESEKSIKEIIDDIQKLEKPVEKVQASDFCLYDFIDRLACAFTEVDLYECKEERCGGYICSFNLNSCESILKIYGPCSVYKWDFKERADCALKVYIVNDVSDVLHKGITKEDWDMRSKIISEYCNKDVMSTVEAFEHINADDIKPDDEWMLENKWDDIYTNEYGHSVATQQEELGTVHVSDGEWKGTDVNA